MSRALFVSNGHGEIAIAARIAGEIRGIACDHLALVGGEHAVGGALHDVGPRKGMPSGGLIAMGNVRNIARDVSSGLLAHTFAQLKFLRGSRGAYEAAVAVGDVFALIMTLQVRARATIFVGTAKSVHHAKYGALERRIIAKSQRVFVRDEATAASLRAHGIDAQPANVIVDLYAGDAPAIDTRFSPRLAIFPGSREAAYADAAALCAIVRELGTRSPQLGAVLSIAPSLDPQRMVQTLRASGWRVDERDDALQPFSLFSGEREIVRAWRGPLGSMLDGAQLVLGQAGTANEAAAAAGIPVVAYEPSSGGKRAWYRARQAGLLGGALLIIEGSVRDAADAVGALLDDAPRRARMGEIGRERMGPPGGAATIARAVEAFAGVRA